MRLSQDKRTEFMRNARAHLERVAEHKLKPVIDEYAPKLQAELDRIQALHITPEIADFLKEHNLTRTNEHEIRGAPYPARYGQSHPTIEVRGHSVGYRVLYVEKVITNELFKEFKEKTRVICEPIMEVSKQTEQRMETIQTLKELKADPALSQLVPESWLYEEEERKRKSLEKRRAALAKKVIAEERRKEAGIEEDDPALRRMVATAKILGKKEE